MFFVILIIKFTTESGVKSLKMSVTIAEIGVKLLKLSMNITKNIFLKLAALLIMNLRGHKLGFDDKFVMQLTVYAFVQHAINQTKLLFKGKNWLVVLESLCN